MEDVKKRLEFANPFVQHQALWKLYAEIERKKPVGRITADAPEVAELRTLWAVLCGEQAGLAETAGTVLVQLVLNDVADFTFILHGILNRVPSARTVGGVVTALGQLLVLEAAAMHGTDGGYTCPHSLRSPTHPFITVLTHRPAAWPLLTSQVEQLALHHDIRVQRLSTDMLRPFVKFVLLEPTPSHPQAPLLRLQLQQLLLHVCRHSAAGDTWLSLLLDALPCYQANTAEAVSQLVEHVRHLLGAVCVRDRSVASGGQGQERPAASPAQPQQRPAGTCSQDLSRLTHIALTLVLPAAQCQLHVQGLVDSVLQALQDFPQCLAGQNHLSQLCAVLMELGPLTPLALLQLVERAVSATELTSCSAVGAAILVLPLLQFLAGASPGGGGGGALLSAAAHHRQLVTTATAALEAVERLLQQTAVDDGAVAQVLLGTRQRKAGERFKPIRHLFGSAVKSESISHLLSVITNNVHDTRVWLSHLHQHLAGVKESESVSWETTCVVSSVLVLHTHSAVISLAMEVLVHIARLDNSKAPLFLPLLLYCLGRQSEPHSRLLLLDTIPQLAQHKVCVPPILRTLQALMTSPGLRPLATRLMTSLWRLQDRCFPQLLRAIGEDESSSPSSAKSSASMPLEMLLAKAAAVREICRLKPEQHGAELLSPLSSILTTATDAQGAAPSALALEGLYYLCEAQVIDIQSAWSVLSRQLASDERTVVVVKICQLFSLVPSLAVDTPDSQTFQESCLATLWRYARSSQPRVQGAAFRALAAFSAQDFRVSHLPTQVCEDLHRQVSVVRQQDEGSEVTVDTLFTFIPGVCYTRLLQSLPLQVLPDYEALLSSLVGGEVDQLPRGLYHTAMRRHGLSSNQDKAIGSIPAFISQQYDKTKQPGLRPSLAAALLFCYDPPVEVGRDGRPRKHYLGRHGKAFMATFKTLLNEVPVQPSEWHRSLLMPQAWVSFVDRLCLALIESRGAELDSQAKNGHISEDQREDKTHTAWLFVRDTIVDTLKVASKGNPSQQANAVLALTALVVFMSRFASGLDPELLKECDTATEHLSHSHWLSVAVDTILSIRDVSYKPRGQLLGLCQQRTAEDRTAACSLAQGTAYVCLGPLTPCVTSGHSDVLLQLLDELTGCLPGGSQAPESPVLLWQAGLALGSVLARLWHHGFVHTSGPQGMQTVMQAMEALEDCCLDTTRQHRAGSLLGLGLALTGLCQEGTADSRTHLATLWDRLGSLLDNTSPQDSTYQTLCFALACMSGAAFSANILTLEQMNATLHQLEMAHHSNPQVTGSSLGLGMLCYTLSKMGHPGVAALRQTLTSQWMKAVTSADTAPMEKIAALNGLMAMIGSEQTLTVVQAGVSLTSSDVKVSEVLEMVTRMVQGDPDLGMQCNAAWMLGHLYLSACAVADTRASVPPNYAYLPEASFLRAIVDLLLEAGKQGPELVTEQQVKVALVALQDDVRRVLPPLNWAGVLSPLMRMPFGEESKRACLSLAVSQSASSPTAAMFLSSWLTPPLSLTLADESKRCLFLSLPTLIKSVPISVLSTFLERSCCQPFDQHAMDQPLALAVLQGLRAALRVPDPPAAVTALLYTTAGRLYCLMPAQFQPELYGEMAECLAAVPDEVFDSITAEDYKPGTCTLREFFIGCYLVARGNQPITLLNGLIDSAMNDPECDGQVLVVLTHCFWRLVEQRTDTSGPMARLNWLLELLGHTRNVITGVMPLTSPSQTLRNAVEFSVLVVAMATNLLTATRPSPDFGLDPALLKVTDKDGASPKAEKKVSKEKSPIRVWHGQLKETFLQQLPVAVLSFERPPWDQLLPKVYDWLLTISRLPDDLLTPDLKHYVTAALLLLRHTSEFRKMTNWTRVLTTV